MKKYLAAAVAVFVWFLIWDNVISSPLLGQTMSSIPGVKADISKLWETIGDLCSALVVCGVYGRVRSVFGEGMKEGAIYGVYAGVLLNFPTWLNMTNYFGWPYGAAWTFTVALLVLYVVAGAIMGTVYKAMGAPKPA
jgi:hypothetical protein